MPMPPVVIEIAKRLGAIANYASGMFRIIHYYSPTQINWWLRLGPAYGP